MKPALTATKVGSERIALPEDQIGVVVEERGWDDDSVANLLLLNVRAHCFHDAGGLVAHVEGTSLPPRMPWKLCKSLRHIAAVVTLMITSVGALIVGLGISFTVIWYGWPS